MENLNAANIPIEDAVPSRWQMLREQLGEKGVLTLFLLPAVAVLIITQGYPLVYSAYFSLFDWTLARSQTPGAFLGVGNYTRAFGDNLFTDAMSVTVMFALTATFFEMLIGFALAYLTIGEKWWLQVARTLLIMPMVIAPVAVGTMWRMMFSARAGLVNYLLSLIGITGPDWLGDPDVALNALIIVDVWQWTPFVMMIFVAALSALPAEPFRAAEVDGASRWQIFRHITLPLLMPVTMLVLMFRLIDALITLDIVYTTTFGGPGFKTHTLSFLIQQQGLRYFNISYAAAMSWILLLGCFGVAIGLIFWRRRLGKWQEGR